MPNAYMMAAQPPLPIESTPPPPPPPLQKKPYENSQNIVENEQQASMCKTDQNISKQLQSLNDNETTILTSSNKTQVHHVRSINLESSNFLHHDRRRQPNRKNNQNNRIFVGNNRIQTNSEEQMILNYQQNDKYVNEVKSQEEIAFDIQFRKWEESFLEWKKNNANHPDQNQYNDFVIKMEACRNQLFSRREQLRQKRLGSNMQTNSETKASQQTQAEDNSVHSQSGTAFFITKSEGVSEIPGLDGFEEKSPKANLNIVAHVNNILGDPEIKNFLSSIQKKSSNSHTEASSNVLENTNQSINSLQLDSQQCSFQTSTNQFENNAKYRRRDHNGSKRIREIDSSLPQNDNYEDYRPVQVIDYQNRSEKISPVNDQFPRKIIEYNHKSNIHTWNWFCPIFQIEYNHFKTGLSLHEHPLPRPISTKQEQQLTVKKEPREQYQKLLDPKWTHSGTIERLERFSYGSRYENSQTSNELYYRRKYNNA